MGSVKKTITKPAKKTTTKPKAKAPQTPVETGQVWKMEDSRLEISLVGKTLVHYKHFKGLTKRAPISLSAKDALEKYLKTNKAMLVQE